MSEYERDFWQDCANTFHEEQKQIVVAARLGLLARWTGAHPPSYPIGGRSVLDIGGGPVSLLLKCTDRGKAVVADPGDFPPWVFARYEHCGIGFWHGPAEDINDDLMRFDEAWIYNTLQHVIDPEKVVRVARRHAATVRVFEWVDLAPYEGHPHMLTQALLDGWLGAPGFVANLNESGCVGRCYYGVFRGNS